MSIEQALNDRSGSTCELCGAGAPLAGKAVEPSDGSAERSILLCKNCVKQIATNTLDANHFRCLTGCVWSPVPAVQVMAYRLLKKMTGESWVQEVLETIYLEPEVQAWADDVPNVETPEEEAAPTKDSNGAQLLDGDTVTLIKNLDVKGTSFVAKRGTLVKNISLTFDPANVEGRVNGVQIVLKTCFLKKG